MFKISKAAIVAGTLTILASVLAYAAQDGIAIKSSGYQVAVDDKGQIRLPDVDFRKDWASLGAWAIAAEEGKDGSQGMHVVYTQPDAVSGYRETGKFPDGTVLIKELFSTSTQEMTTGTVSRADKTTGWFVMVKDTDNRFPENKLWGDGWGWAYFDAGNREMTKTADYQDECKDCHVPVEDSDWVYTEGYPVLKN
jgi:hypothetical protein